MTIEEVLALDWPALNEALLKCNDEVELQCWLTATVASGKKARARRIHGRLNAVRRDKELASIGEGLAKAGKEDAA